MMGRLNRSIKDSRTFYQGDNALDGRSKTARARNWGPECGAAKERSTENLKFNNG
jgi:hypothetical protein